jgi:hypothetical protein
VVDGTSPNALQQAVDLVADGGTVIVRAGAYNASLALTNKVVTIAGDGADRTAIKAVAGRPVIALGPGATLHIQGVSLVGGTAGVSATTAVDGKSLATAPTLDMQQCVIRDGDRGIIGNIGKISLERVTISHTRSDGVVLITPRILLLRGLSVSGTGGFGLFIRNQVPRGAGDVGTLRIMDSTFNFNAQGGIAITGNARPISIENCSLVMNVSMGIRLESAGDAQLVGVTVFGTLPQADGSFGDGLFVLDCSHVYVIGCSFILNSQEAITYVATTVLAQNTLFWGNGIDLAGEDLSAVHDLGGNRSFTDAGVPQPVNLMSSAVELPPPITNYP